MQKLTDVKYSVQALTIEEIAMEYLSFIIDRITGEKFDIKKHATLANADITAFDNCLSYCESEKPVKSVLHDYIIYENDTDYSFVAR